MRLAVSTFLLSAAMVAPGHAQQPAPAAVPVGVVTAEKKPISKSLDFVGRVSPRAILLGHGGDDSRRWFEEQIRARHPKIKIIQPQPGKSVEV